MKKRLKLCEACNEPFNWDDDVILVESDVYHKDCVTLYPMSYFAMLDDEPLGETENDDGDEAYNHLDDDELEETL